MRKIQWRNWLILLLFWTLVGLIYSSQLRFFDSVRGSSYSWGHYIAEALADWYTWAVLTPLILRLAKRYPFTQRRWSWVILLHLPASLLIAAAQLFIQAAADQIFIHQQYSLAAITGQLPQLFTRKYYFCVLVYWAIVFVHQSIAYYQQQQLQAAQLETRLAQAQLQALKMQLHPHFLFNTLHAISTLVHEDPKAADQMIARLSELLRLTLANQNRQEVALAQELEFLHTYLEIERLRFQDRLTVKLNIAPETLDARVPNLILQPLVENSIRHGIAARRGAGWIEIGAARHNGTLDLHVRDNGAGLPTSGTFQEGVGLANTRARLAQLYGDRHHFEMANRVTGGLEVRLKIPWHGGNDD